VPILRGIPHHIYSPLLGLEVEGHHMVLGVLSPSSMVFQDDRANSSTHRISSHPLMEVLSRLEPAAALRYRAPLVYFILTTCCPKCGERCPGVAECGGQGLFTTAANAGPVPSTRRDL
jgi:hypothetical protein